ncbi:hypothetical protein [uncultured Enterovirga sp.]|uniref:hypothetical protein n=1 Tax=uncultured Enterovirga sp. TaxID=2026352 RepID=UPI0035CAF069
MSTPSTMRSASLAGVAFIGALFAAMPAQAGLFDFLFGGDGFRQPPPPQYLPPQAPIDVRVNPRRRAPGSSASKPTMERAVERKPVISKPIDPVARPNWFLEDPTLRRGDIVVLKGQVLVFNGARGAVTPAAFTSLDRSSLVSRAEKTRIEKMADTTGPAVEPVAKAAPNKAAALVATE